LASTCRFYIDVFNIQVWLNTLLIALQLVDCYRIIQIMQ
jgi:hypothetical protein